MRISDWSSDVCSSDLATRRARRSAPRAQVGPRTPPRRPPGTTAAGAVRATATGRVDQMAATPVEIGRASCRESVSVRVDLGGGRSITKKQLQKLKHNLNVDISTTQHTQPTTNQ